MTEVDIQRLLGPEAREIFMQFPLPLALVHESGQNQFNTRFSRYFDHQCIASPQLRTLLSTPGLGWQAVSLLSRAGKEADLYAQVMPVPQGKILVFGESEQVMHDVELNQLRKRIADLEKVSATDYLTGAWNRAHLVRVVSSEMARSIRFRQPLSALLIDIDHFKDVNDTFGHQSGDTVLREVVALIQKKIRSADLLFRWGGEEFCLAFSSEPAQSAYGFVARLLGDFREQAFSNEHGESFQASFSAGIASLPDDGTSLEQLLRKADERLYQAKAQGRNRVCAAADTAL